MNKVKNWIIAVLSIILIAGLFETCHLQRVKNAQITQLQIDKQRTDSVVNARGQVIQQQDVIITNNTQAIKDLSDSNFALKKRDQRQIKNVIAYYKGITTTKLDSVRLPYVDTVATHKFQDSVERQCADVIKYYNDNFISVPRTAGDTTEFYKAKVTITKANTSLTLSIPDSQYIRFVTLKGGLLKKDIYGKRHFILKKHIVVQVLHTNKLIDVTGQTSAIYQPPKKLNLLPKALLVGVGILIGTKL